MLNFNILSSFINAGLINQLLFLLLVVISIFSWALILQKLQSIYNNLTLLKTLELALNSTSTLSLESYIFSRKNDYSEMLTFILSNYKSLSAENIKKNCYTLLAKKNYGLSYRVGYLAVISNSAPFIGLLGTVIGVVNSFQQIAKNSSTSLASIAPGISEALYATALGLFVAIPASVAFNIINMYLDNIETKEEQIIDKMIYILSIKT